MSGFHAPGRPASFVVLVLLVFGLVYNVSFLAAPSLSTGRLALLGLLIVTGTEGIRELKARLQEHWSALAIISLLLAYALALHLSAGAADTTQVSRLVHLALLSLVGGALTVVACGRDLSRYAQVFATAVWVQSLFIGLSFISPDYRRWLATMVVEGGNIPLTNALQVPGFSNSSGALLSLQQGLGVFAALFGARLARSSGVRLLLLIEAACTALSTVVVARTGLQMALFFALLFTLTGGGRAVWRFVVVAAAVVVLVQTRGEEIVQRLTAINPEAPASLDRAFRIFIQRRADESLRELSSQYIPPISLETVLGTGLVSAGPGRGNASANDSGYVQTFYALGLPMAIVFYATLLLLVARLWATGRARVTLGMLLLLMFVVEIKEPFIFKYSYLYFLVTLLWLDRADPWIATVREPDPQGAIWGLQPALPEST